MSRDIRKNPHHQNEQVVEGKLFQFQIDLLVEPNRLEQQLEVILVFFPDNEHGNNKSDKCDKLVE